MNDVTIRRAVPGDAAAIAEIYNHYVAATTATFDEEPKSVVEREQWLIDHGAGHPVMVAVADDRVVGWASLTRWGTRPAYRHTSEVGVYVRHGATGKGIGTRLLGSVIEAAGELQMHALIALVVSDNVGSLELMRRCGFADVGIMREVGFKFGRWLDVVIMELLLKTEDA